MIDVPDINFPLSEEDRDRLLAKVRQRPFDRDSGARHY